MSRETGARHTARRIVKLREAGLLFREIAAETGISRNEVQRIYHGALAGKFRFRADRRADQEAAIEELARAGVVERSAVAAALGISPRTVSHRFEAMGLDRQERLQLARMARGARKPAGSGKGGPSQSAAL